MKFRFTIARKLMLGFGILTLAFLFNTLLTYITMDRSRSVNEEITRTYAPSSQYINDLLSMINHSKLLIKNWVFIDKVEQTPDKQKLKELHEVDYPALTLKLERISNQWSPEHQEMYKQINTTIRDTLFVYHQLVMDMLSTVESYEDLMILFEVEPMVEDGGEIMNYTENIESRLSQLLSELDDIVRSARMDMVDSFDRFQKTILYMGLFILLAIVLIAFLTIRALVNPINKMKDHLMSMRLGILPDEEIKQTNDEMGEMAIALNKLVAALKQISDFATAIGRGNFNKAFTPLSDQDKLGLSLINMRENLREASIEDKRRQDEDEQRSWHSNGIAKFSDILRNNNNDLDALSYDIISNLVQYIGANQGGLFIVNDQHDQDKFIEMKACYAYDRQKFLHKRIEMQEGLVGRCVNEAEVIYLTEIPDDYMNIVSGMGEEKPSCILLVPLLLNDEVYGVFEIASFQEIVSYKIDFVKHLGESVASTLASVKANMQTQYLLSKTRHQTDEMLSQEEEMRQNMEELQATQEESERREQDLIKQIEILKNELEQHKK